MTKTIDVRHRQTSDAAFRRLAKRRAIDANTLERWGLAWDAPYWLLPGRRPSGKVHDIRRWHSKQREMRSTPGCSVQLYGADQLSKASAIYPVWVCEGEWDAMALDAVLKEAKNPDIVVGVPGAATFKTEWVELFRDRHVRLCYDADEPGQKGATKAIKLLFDDVREIEQLAWPDDVKPGFDVRDLITTKRDSGATPRQVLRSLISMLEPIDEASTPIDGAASRGERGLTDPHVLAKKILAKEYTDDRELTLRFYIGSWWIWEGASYRTIDDREMRAMINNQLLTVLDDAECRKMVDQSVVANVMRAMEGLSLVKGTVSLPSWVGRESFAGTGEYLAMENGLLELDAALAEPSNCIRAQTPGWFSVTSWPFAYEPEARCPKWRRFLREVLPRRLERQLLQEFLGYCLSFDTNQHKFLVLVGEGANGKSVVTEVATHVLGPDNVTHVGLERFGDRFSMAPMVGKLANIVSELGPMRGVAEGVLKSVVSGDRIQVEHKYCPPQYVRLTTRLIFAANELPAFHDRSQGLWRRLIVLPFNVTIPEHEQDKTLAQRICAEEAPGIFNWMLEGLRRLRGRGTFNLPLSAKAAAEAHRLESNPALTFLTENCKPDSTAKVSCSFLYQKYVSRCELQKLKPLTTQQFGREVHRAFPEVIRKQERGSGSRRYCYFGIRG